MPRTVTAILKYINNETASTIVVINGLAITAGSKPIFFAIIGRVLPTIFAHNMVIISVKHTIKAIVTDTLSINNNLIKFAIAKVIPISIATLISLNITLNIAKKRIKPK